MQWVSFTPLPHRGGTCTRVGGSTQDDPAAEWQRQDLGLDAGAPVCVPWTSTLNACRWGFDWFRVGPYHGALSSLHHAEIDGQ